MADNSFDARADLEVGGETYEIFRLDALQSKFDVARLPFSLKILLENLLRNEDGGRSSKEDIEALASWDANAEPSEEIAFTPARVLMQDFTGVPAVVDLAAMRDAMADNRRRPVEDQPARARPSSSSTTPCRSTRSAPATRSSSTPSCEFERNEERYAFLRWGQDALRQLRGRAARHRHRPPGQPRVPRARRLPPTRQRTRAPPGLPRHARRDRLAHDDDQRPRRARLGRRRHRGRGGDARPADVDADPAGGRLQAHAASCPRARPRPTSCSPSPRCCASTASSASSSSSTAPACARLPLADRATIGNMRPEFGSTCAIFPIDAETLRYLEFSGRPKERVELVEAYAKEQGLWHDEDSEEPTYSDTLELDLVRGRAVARRPEAPAGPRLADRVQGRLPRSRSRTCCPTTCEDPKEGKRRPGRGRAPTRSRPPTRRRRATDNGHDDRAPDPQQQTDGGTGGLQVAERVEVTVPVTLADGTETELDHGHVVIAAITSCTNTSNPSVMLGAGLLARNAVEKGLKSKPWVKTSLAPGSKVVTEYLRPRGADRRPRGARLPPRRLRLHDVHRQLRAAAGGDLRRRQGRATSRSSRCSRATATSRAASTPT